MADLAAAVLSAVAGATESTVAVLDLPSHTPSPAPTPVNLASGEGLLVDVWAAHRVPTLDAVGLLVRERTHARTHTTDRCRQLVLTGPRAA